MKGQCILCDKSIDTEIPGSFTVMGNQTGRLIHGDCYRTWIREKMRGRDL